MHYPTNVITIDGPAGAGKTTIAQCIAKELGLLYLDTGAMYRAIALGLHRRKVPPRESPQLEAVLRTIDLEVILKENTNHLLLNGEDVTPFIRTPEISKLASDYSTLLPVRNRLVDLQRQIAHRRNLVVEGRDMGTVVFPNASFKFFLVADLGERSRRRFQQRLERGEEAELQQIAREVAARDRQDTSRRHAPLMRAPDAVTVDTTHLSIEQVVDSILKIIRAVRTNGTV